MDPVSLPYGTSMNLRITFRASQCSSSPSHDFELKWPEQAGEHPAAETLIQAVHEQLGLELSAAKRPVEVLIVDTATKEKE